MIKKYPGEYNKHMTGDISYFGFFMTKCMEEYSNTISYEVLKLVVNKKLFDIK